MARQQLAVLEKEMDAGGLIAERPTIKWLSAEEILKAQTPEAIIEKLAYLGTVAQIVAPPKTGKSMAVAQMLACIASGIEFLGLRIPKAVKVGVLTLELGAGPYRERVESICRDVGIPLPKWDENFHVVAPLGADVPEIALEKDGHVEAIFEEAAARGLEVLALDTLQRFMISDEPAEVKLVYRRLSDAAGRTGIAVIVVDETAKSWGGPETTTNASVAAYGSVFKGAISNVCMALKRRGLGESATSDAVCRGPLPGHG